jgi:hypothetical protein
MSASNPYETPSGAAVTYAGQRTYTLKQIDVLSCGLMLGVLYALLGLLAGGFFSLFAMVGAAANNANMLGGILTGVGAVIIMPLFYGVGGFIFGLIGALVYNVCASIVGGIKIDLE